MKHEMPKQQETFKIRYPLMEKECGNLCENHILNDTDDRWNVYYEDGKLYWLSVISG